MSEVENLEQHLLDVKELVERRDMALKLAENREFRTLIVEDYMLKEAARCIQASGDDKLTPQIRADMVDMAKATGYLKRFLSAIITMGGTAANDISEIEDALSAARSEEDAAAIDGGELISDGGELS